MVAKKYAADPNAPKRPLSAYFHFAADVRQSVVKKMGDNFSIGAVGKEIGKMWTALSKAKRAPYQKKADAAKAKYQKLNAKYRKTAGYTAWAAGREDHKKAAKAQEKRDALKAMLPNKPKRGLTSYMRFCNANRSKHSGSITEVAQALGKAWSSASAAVKAKFQKQVDAANAKYDKAMAKYVKTDEYKAYEVAYKEYTKEMTKIRKYGSVKAADRAVRDRTRLAARAKTQKAKEMRAKKVAKNKAKRAKAKAKAAKAKAKRMAKRA